MAEGNEEGEEGGGVVFASRKKKGKRGKRNKGDGYDDFSMI